jgi:hypothetical protein
VQFIATGIYDSSPTGVTPQPATWGACDSTAKPATDVSVTSDGLALCAPGAPGTFTVYAYDHSKVKVCPQLSPSGCGFGPCQITGTAKLTCPCPGEQCRLQAVPPSRPSPPIPVQQRERNYPWAPARAPTGTG